MISLRRLSSARRTALRVLYLAPHAPAPGAAPPPAVHPEFGVQAAYQYEIWDLLSNGLNLDVESRSDLGVLPQAFKGRNYVFTIYNIAPFRNSEVYVSALAGRRRHRLPGRAAERPRTDRGQVVDEAHGAGARPADPTRNRLQPWRSGAGTCL